MGRQWQGGARGDRCGQGTCTCRTMHWVISQRAGRALRRATSRPCLWGNSTWARPGLSYLRAISQRNGTSDGTCPPWLCFEGSALAASRQATAPIARAWGSMGQHGAVWGSMGQSHGRGQGGGRGKLGLHGMVQQTPGGPLSLPLGLHQGIMICTECLQPKGSIRHGMGHTAGPHSKTSHKGGCAEHRF